MTARKLTHRLADEHGEAAILSGILLLAGVLIPLMLLVALYARVELAAVDAQQASHSAVLSAVEAQDPAAANNAASAAVAREQAGTRLPLTLRLTGTFARGEVMSANVSTSVPIGTLPFLGHFGTITVHAHASAPVDRYRSLVESAEP
jgi:hypothetical protein